MGGSAAAKAVLAATVAATLLASVTPVRTATPEHGRLQVQVRNVGEGRALSLSLSDRGITDWRVLDIRPGGAANAIDREAVQVDGRNLLVRAHRRALNVNLTIGLICRPACPAELTGEARIPDASYAFLRTAVDDRAITRSGSWTVRLATD